MLGRFDLAKKMDAHIKLFRDAGSGRDSNGGRHRVRSGLYQGRLQMQGAPRRALGLFKGTRDALANGPRNRP